MARISKVCKDCNKPFSISDKEQEWLRENNLSEFERCSQCREKRRNGKPKVRKPRDYFF
jgi:uncharacterized protein with PIN domain